MAEESGQIIELGRWVLSEALPRASRTGAIRSPPATGLRVAVNISGRHLQQGDLVGDVSSALEIVRPRAGEPASSS